MLIFSDLRALTSLPDTSTIMTILMPRFIHFLQIPFQMSSTNWGSLNTLCTTILLSHNKPIYNVFFKSVQIKWPFYSYLLKVFIKKRKYSHFYTDFTVKTGKSWLASNKPNSPMTTFIVCGRRTKHCLHNMRN